MKNVDMMVLDRTSVLAERRPRNRFAGEGVEAGVKMRLAMGGLPKSFAEMAADEKNRYSHRAKAFRKLAEFLASSPVL